MAAKRLLARRFAGLGYLVGSYYMELDKRHLRAADHVVHITDAFCELTEKWGVDTAHTSVIPNWGALDAITLKHRETSWARQQGLTQGLRFLYAGTLALKHNPALISDLATAVGDVGEVILVSSGVGADQLRRQSASLPALRCLPLQPFHVFDEVLGSADVLLAVIERDAGTFSVPSKVLSYLCAGRPIVLAAPSENLAARMVLEAGAGAVVAPEDNEGFVRAAMKLATDPKLAREAGLAGRAYAEANFDINAVADRFEAVFIRAIDARLSRNHKSGPRTFQARQLSEREVAGAPSFNDRPIMAAGEQR